MVCLILVGEGLEGWRFRGFRVQVLKLHLIPVYGFRVKGFKARVSKL